MKPSLAPTFHYIPRLPIPSLAYIFIYYLVRIGRIRVPDKRGESPFYHRNF
jgi:hypothetical protein